MRVSFRAKVLCSARVLARAMTTRPAMAAEHASSANDEARVESLRQHWCQRFSDEVVRLDPLTLLPVAYRTAAQLSRAAMHLEPVEVATRHYIEGTISKSQRQPCTRPSGMGNISM